jgi:uncharacterized protein YdeI (YjbR/CyaY-like superfamily)
MKNIPQVSDFTRGFKTFYPKNIKAWRQWLLKNHQSEQSVWVICNKKSSGKTIIPWSDFVDEALCFGWIDSVRKSVSDDQFMQFFTKRKPKSAWSKINKEKVKRLIAEELMLPAGLESIKIAKQNGSWSILDTVETLTIPKDLSAALKAHAGSKEFFLGLSKSVRKAILQWVIMAKRPETRAKRIIEVAELAAQKKKPKQF